MPQPITTWGLLTTTKATTPKPQRVTRKPLSQILIMLQPITTWGLLITTQVIHNNKYQTIKKRQSQGIKVLKNGLRRIVITGKPHPKEQDISKSPTSVVFLFIDIYDKRYLILFIWREFNLYQLLCCFYFGLDVKRRKQNHHHHLKIVQVLQAATTYAGVQILPRSITTAMQPSMTGAARAILIMVIFICSLTDQMPMWIQGICCLRGLIPKLPGSKEFLGKPLLIILYQEIQVMHFGRPLLKDQSCLQVTMEIILLFRIRTHCQQVYGTLLLLLTTLMPKQVR